MLIKILWIIINIKCKLQSSRNPNILEKEFKNINEEESQNNYEIQNKLISKLKEDEEHEEQITSNFSNDATKIEKFDTKSISRNQDEIFNQLVLNGKIEGNFTNKFLEVKNYKNYKIYNQLEFIRK